MKSELTAEELRKAEKKGANLAPVDFEKMLQAGLKVGMADGDTRRHFYEMQRDYPMRYCTMTAGVEHLVLMKDIPVDCKRCLAKKKSFYDRQ